MFNGKISRFSRGQPILYPVKNTPFSKAIYNPAAILVSKKVHLLARIESTDDSCTGKVALFIEKKPMSYNFKFKKIVMWPEFDYDCFGCEDPRITKIGKIFVITYTGNGKYKGKQSGHSCIATSKNLRKWQKHGPMFENKNRWRRFGDKPGGIVSEKIKDNYIFHFSGHSKGWVCSIGIAFSEGDNFLNWNEPKDTNPIVKPRIGYFDSKGLEPGPPATIRGNVIELIYNGWNEKFYHQPGVVQFSKDNPIRVLVRTNRPLFEAKTRWETIGDTRNVPKKVIFIGGYIERNGAGEIYYGASDLYTCMAKFEPTIFYPRFNTQPRRS